MLKESEYKKLKAEFLKKAKEKCEKFNLHENAWDEKSEMGCKCCEFYCRRLQECSIFNAVS